jgi:tetratricopeptide (TPR) repeat protein
MRGVVVASTCVAAILAGSRFAPTDRGAPYVPAGDAVVVARAEPRDPSREQLALRLRGRDTDLDSALALARGDLARARSRADPRSLGRAQAALAPWWDLAEPPLEVLVARATIRQSLHDFEGARGDLDRALRADPRHLQALLTQATISTVVGDYADARAMCARFAEVGPPVPSAVCAALVRSLTGGAAEARQDLERALALDGGAVDAGTRSWALGALADVTERAGDLERASSLREELARADPDDVPSLVAWADGASARGRDAEVVARLATRTEVDALLLRLAVAEKATGAPAWRDHARVLEARFDAARARGDAVHRREEALYWLRVGGDDARALSLAAANVQVQREPLDVRLVLEAAARVRDPAAAAATLAWIDRSGFADPSIAPLAAALRKARP